MKNAIEVRHLSKQYSGFALQDVSFTVPCGSIMGFVGENGAGKTTTIKAILGLIRPDGGETELLGRPMSDAEREVKSQIGVVFDETYFHDNLTLRVIDKMLGHIYNCLLYTSPSSSSSSLSMAAQSAIASSEPVSTSMMIFLLSI